MLLTGRAKAAYDHFQELDKELLAKADGNGGRLEKHNWWRRVYYRYPYLILEGDDVITERFIDVFENVNDLSVDGKLDIRPMMANDGQFAQRFTELIEETNWRGILTRDVVDAATKHARAYFANGVPAGVKMFERHTKFEKDWLVKYSKREFVDEMLRYGRFRISPASHYSKGSLIRAVRDFETRRQFKLKAIKEVLDGQVSVEVQGRAIPIRNGVVSVEVVMDDYYLFSMCSEISRRMPTDFEADSALVIKDRLEFLRRFRAAVAPVLQGWEFLHGDVYYFDPYHDIPRQRDQEMWKHFAYTYQKEHRYVMRRRVAPAEGDLMPFVADLGPLTDIAEAVFTDRD